MKTLIEVQKQINELITGPMAPVSTCPIDIKIRKDNIAKMRLLQSAKNIILDPHQTLDNIIRQKSEIVRQMNLYREAMRVIDYDLKAYPDQIKKRKLEWRKKVNPTLKTKQLKVIEFLLQTEKADIF